MLPDHRVALSTQAHIGTHQDQNKYRAFEIKESEQNLTKLLQYILTCTLSWEHIACNPPLANHPGMSTLLALDNVLVHLPAQIKNKEKVEEK